MKRRENEPAPTLDLLDERACAYQKSMVFMRQAYPNGAVMTYDHRQARGSEHILLAKFVIGIGEAEPLWLTYPECTDETTADNIPGGLLSRVKTVNGDTFRAAWYPLLHEEDDKHWEGAALLHIHSDIPRRFWLKFGCGNIAFMHFSPNKNMAGAKIDCEEGRAEIDTDQVIIRRKDRSLTTVVRGNFEQIAIESLPDAEEGFGTYAVTQSFGTDIYVVTAFSEDPERAKELAACDPVKEEENVHKYYAALLENWQLSTPDPVLNEAFQHALLNVEYSWLYPYGWIESLHHWPTMWHMEHTAAEEWNGRYDRVARCLLTQMENAFSNGAIPDMCPNGAARRDWGGNNQFFFREVEHYVKMTGDISFAAKAEPYLEKALHQTFAEYDPTGSGVIGWGTQIGNQEDFESTPGKGAATGIEGVRMLEIMSYIKNILGKTEEAANYMAASQYCRQQWYDYIWKKDIGRPIWYEDIHGKRRLETTYHGIIYPILYDYIDDADKVSALDHLRHRLSGPEGEVYQSNHFGDHAYYGIPTWGMQCGSDMQPFASAAYASVGMKKEAVEPLAFIAKRVCGEYQRGAWPETANEKRFAYFSPSAAVFSQGIIESVFGLKRDRIANTTTITPAIPEDWPEASLRLPEAQITYTTQENGFTLRVQIPDDTQKIIRVLCPPSSHITIKTKDGEKTVSAKQHCGWSSAEFPIGTGSDITVTCRRTPIGIRCSSVPAAACGEPWSAQIGGDVELAGVEDRCGVLDRLEWRQNALSAVLRPDLLKEYENYGWFGLINFARRSLFLKLRLKASAGGAPGETFLYPCAVTLMPPVHCKARFSPETHTVEVEIYNQTAKALSGTWHLLYNKHCLRSGGTALPKQKSTLSFDLKNQDICFSPGKNRAVLSGPATAALDIEASVPDARIEVLPLNADQCKPSGYWREIGLHTSHGHMMQGPDFFMKDLWEQFHDIPILDGVPLPLDPNGFLPFSKEKHPLVTIPLYGKKIKKVYLLCSAFIDNHDIFSKVLHIEAEAEKKDAYIRPVFLYDCHYPGMLDMGFGNPVIAGFATFVNGTDRGCIPELPVKEGMQDYPDAMPPAYPQKSLWSSSKAIECCHTVFNLLELDFGDFREMKEIRITSCEADAAGGIFAMAVHTESE